MSTFSTSHIPYNPSADVIQVGAVTTNGGASDLSRTEIRAIVSDTVVDVALLKEWYHAIVVAYAAVVETRCTTSPQWILNTSSLHAGIYLLKVVTANGMETAKFVKN